MKQPHRHPRALTSAELNRLTTCREPMCDHYRVKEANCSDCLKRRPIMSTPTVTCYEEHDA